MDAIFCDEYAKNLFPQGNEKMLDNMLERMWGPEREMLDWELGDRPDLLPDKEDIEIDNEIRPVDHWDPGRIQKLVLHLISC